jgi:hypothetical protein
MKSRRIKIKEKYSKKKMKGGANGAGANAAGPKPPRPPPKEELTSAGTGATSSGASTGASTGASSDAIAFLKRIRAALMTELSTSNPEEKLNVETRLLTALRNTKKNKTSVSDEQSQLQLSQSTQSMQQSQSIQAASNPSVYNFELEKNKFVYKTLDNRINPRQKNAIANFLTYYKSRSGITSALLSKTLGTGDYFTQDQYEYLIELSRNDYPFDFSKLLNDTLIYIRENCMKKNDKNSSYLSMLRPFKTVEKTRTIDNTAENTRDLVAKQKELLEQVNELISLNDENLTKLQTISSISRKKNVPIGADEYVATDKVRIENQSNQVRQALVGLEKAFERARDTMILYKKPIDDAEKKHTSIPSSIKDDYDRAKGALQTAEDARDAAKNTQTNISAVLAAIADYEQTNASFTSKKDIILSKTVAPLSGPYFAAAKELGLQGSATNDTLSTYDPFTPTKIVTSGTARVINKDALLEFKQIIERAIVLSNKQLAKDEGLLVSKPR